MKNITYLIGAGASAQCLPIVSNINSRMAFFLTLLNHYHVSRIVVGKHRLEETIKNETLKECLEWVIKEEKEHYSIDTFARKLNLRQEREHYKRLKAVMICYFLFEQKKKGKLSHLKKFLEGTESDLKDIAQQVVKNLDKRYDAFFASILKSNKSNTSDHEDKSPLQFVIAKNIKMISWNYDSQFELSLNGITDLGLFSILEKQVILSATRLETPENPSLIKLNGSTVSLTMKQQLQKNGKSDLVEFIEKESLEDRDMENFFNLYLELIKEPLDYFNFAWESELNQQKDFRIQKAKEIIEKTDCLIVIGYSFPYYNMETDKEILSSIRNDATIYIQDIPGKFETIKDRISYFLPPYVSNDLIEVKQTDLFFLPPEYFGGSGKPKSTFTL